MFSFSLAFLLGDLLLQQLTYLPSLWIAYSLIATCVLASIIFINLKTHFSFFKMFLTLHMALFLGFAWSVLFAHLHMTWELPEDWQGKNLIAQGFIASLPNYTDHRTSFLFKLKKLQLNNEIKTSPVFIKINWQGNHMPELHPGDEWQFTVRMKKIHGILNLGSFDYEAKALEEGIRAQGYIPKNNDNRLLSDHWYHYPLQRAREYLKNKINYSLPPTATSPWITALTVGERNNISAESWEILRNTGTNHLMAIAGLHIGFMSGFVFALVNWSWRRFPLLTLKAPAQHAAAIAALLMTLLYSAMAGFSLPTQRACFMLSIFLIILIARRHSFTWHSWSIALLLTLIFDPLCVLTESFWLSFGAVALILYASAGRLKQNGFWQKWGRIQLILGIGLIPFSFWLFQQCSLIAFIANAIAIPWMGFLILPFCLLGSLFIMMSTKIGTFFLILADKSLNILWGILTWFSHLPWSSWHHAMPNHWVLILCCLGILILFLPKGMPGRLLCCVWFLPFFLYQAKTPKQGECYFTLLDVGQGLSAVVQTKNHFLVYDTGAKLGLNYDMGESVVVPFLRMKDAKKIDMLVISHDDNDHIGGTPAILKNFAVSEIKTSTPSQLPTHHTSYCLRGEKWTWDGIQFEFLYPDIQNLGFDNDSSCVLRITVGNKHILLTGDIEKYAEKKLLENELNNLSTDILIAPHHGSKTSADDDFLKNIHPHFVLFPVGYRNRYHFPNESVIAKYDALNAITLDSAQSGAISFMVSNNMELKPDRYRIVHKHYWNN